LVGSEMCIRDSIRRVEIKTLFPRKRFGCGPAPFLFYEQAVGHSDGDGTGPRWFAAQLPYSSGRGLGRV
ncbi:MAG: hypothetical protein N3B12_05475, partial [Armatimonadetes bacterium]|nr:hypothetical protein [Armatimonadota bacterium]